MEVFMQLFVEQLIKQAETARNETERVKYRERTKTRQNKKKETHTEIKSKTD
jgi:hypothetical protein